MKEWYTAEELAHFEELPNNPSSISRKARMEGWDKRQKQGVKGKAHEYHVSSLPQNVQDKLNYTDGCSTLPIKKVATANAFDVLKSLLSEEEAELLIEQIKSVGMSSLFLSNKSLKTAQIIDELPEESVKEILLLINEAQYCALAGIPFHASKKKDKDIKRA